MMIVIMGLFFLMSSQPVFMVGVLILITFFYSFFLYMLMGSYWFSYAMVMVMLSGVLVVFTYMVTLFPNESFEVYNMVYVVIFMILFFSGSYMIYGSDYSMVSFSLWVNYISMFNMFLVVFLLSIMLMVIWVSGLEGGAIRVMWKYAW
uniref:NADH dehydrogenase subunit 6 n=1 Tax=Agelena silvatica TaxID=648239 RepID=A0A1P8VZA1_9ARAC|nr:NADH dehydrogenase subunit 6 [Agelena silvatica]APZ84008.1 NADH dehydrogenase subunit 6 [Agelena silvatica]